MHVRCHDRRASGDEFACTGVWSVVRLGVPACGASRNTTAQAPNGTPWRHAEPVTDFSAANAPPVFLLRLPPGWRSDPDWKASPHMPQGLRRIHRLLYEETDGKAGHVQLAYGEIIRVKTVTVHKTLG